MKNIFNKKRLKSYDENYSFLFDWNSYKNTKNKHIDFLKELNQLYIKLKYPSSFLKVTWIFASMLMNNSLII